MFKTHGFFTQGGAGGAVIQPPEASNVTFTGTLVEGQTLTGDYDYFSPQGTPESGSTYQWYRDAVAIIGAVNLTYELTALDAGANISFGVTPSDGTLTGEEVISDPQGPVEPLPTIALIDATNELLRTLKFDGTNWSQDGNSLSLTGTGTADMTALTGASIAFCDVDTRNLRTYAWDGEDWSLDGNALNISGMQFSVFMGRLTDTTIALSDAGNDQIRVYAFDGTDWSQVGSGTNLPVSNQPALTDTFSSTRIVIAYQITGTSVEVYDLISGTWTKVGNTLSLASTSVYSIASLTSNRVVIAMTSGGSGSLRVYDFDGTNFTQVGNSLNLGTVGTLTVASLSATRIAFADSTADELRTYEFDGSDFTQVGNDFAISGAGGIYMTCLTYL
jgi:hypothetical protein